MRPPEERAVRRDGRVRQRGVVGLWREGLEMLQEGWCR